jgi:hypothetical protein
VAQKSENLDKFCDNIFAYLALVTDTKIEFWEEISWLEIEDILYKFLQQSLLRFSLPMFQYPQQRGKQEPWEYLERDWYLWAHMLCKTYHWTLEYVAELEVETACALMEEILVDVQMDKEWTWALSEIAYPYNEHTKKSEFKELPRPTWMKPALKMITKIKIPESMMPVGNVITMDELMKRQNVVQ